MKIVHCCLANFYVDNYNYQENYLPRMHKKLGHQVTIVASTETYTDNTMLGYVKPEKYYSNDGIEVTRLPYRKVLPHKVMTKIRAYDGLYDYLIDKDPDLIFIHGMQMQELLTILRYKRFKPAVRLVADSHEDSHNSARNWISKYILHKYYYKRIIKKSLPYIEKVLCLSSESIDFMAETYGINRNILELYPLGGTIYSDVDRIKMRKRIREILDLDQDDLLFVHSGKMSASKNTHILVDAFTKIKSNKIKLVLIGTFEHDYRDIIFDIINKDSRIIYLGWKTGDQLIEYLHASDIYIQPGTQSATMQNAACSNTALALYPYKSHKFLMEDSVFYIENKEEIMELIRSVIENRELIDEKRAASFLVAKTKLDYCELAKRVL